MEGIKIDKSVKKPKFDALWGSARRSERTPGEEKKRWGPTTQAGNLEMAIRDGFIDCPRIRHALLSRWEAADSNRSAHSAGLGSENHCEKCCFSGRVYLYCVVGLLGRKVVAFCVCLVASF